MKPPVVKRPGPTVPSQPFTLYLQKRYATLETEAKEGANGPPGPAVRLAIEIGFVPEGSDRKSNDAAVRRLYRYRNGITDTKRSGKYFTLPVTEFSREVVEHACNSADRDLFYDLYPQLAQDDITLEPDAWCPHCSEMVTPIDGLCPWCECAHGHLFREVGITDDGFACLACAANEHRERNRETSRLWAAKRREARRAA